MLGWNGERALEGGLEKRFRRFRRRVGLRQCWYEAGFRDGWARAKEEELGRRKERGYGEESGGDKRSE